MDYQTIQASVETALGRTDVPSYVYTLTTSGLNRDLRILEMQTETTISATGESVTLPSDFLQLESVYIDANSRRTPLLPADETSQAVNHDSSGRPYYYAVHNGEMTLMPVPDTTYTLVVRYYARLDHLSADADTNDVATNYPGLYVYGALTHAAIWAGDAEAAQTYNGAYSSELDRVRKKDIQRRIGGPLTSKPLRGF